LWWSKIEWAQDLQGTGMYRHGMYYVIGNENSCKRTLTRKSRVGSMYTWVKAERDHLP
jgi:hypothetical protein